MERVAAAEIGLYEAKTQAIQLVQQAAQFGADLGIEMSRAALKAAVHETFREQEG